MKYKNQSHFSPSERLAIIKEYETSNLTLEEISAKYGLKCKNLISVWRSRLQKSKKNSNFVLSNDTNVVSDEPMKEKTKAELEEELAQVKQELEWAKLQNLALNTMIDIAEEQGIRIRKKSGAKQ